MTKLMSKSCPSTTFGTFNLTNPQEEGRARKKRIRKKRRKERKGGRGE